MKLAMNRCWLVMLLALGGCEWWGNGGGYTGNRPPSSATSGPADPSAPSMCMPPTTPTVLYTCRASSADFDRAELRYWDDPATEVTEYLFELTVRDSAADPGVTVSVAEEQLASGQNVYQGDDWKLVLDPSVETTFPSRLYHFVSGSAQVESLTCTWHDFCDDAFEADAIY